MLGLLSTLTRYNYKFLNFCIDQKISALMKEVSKIRGLEDEIQSLSCSEKELEDVKSECERLV